MKIVILDGSAANPGDISWAPLESYGEVIAYDVTTPEELLERMEGAEVAITNKTPFTRETIEKLPELKYIGVLATGFNVVDLEAAGDHGIVVTNVPEYSTFATMQMTIALLLSMTNHVALHSESVHNGDWVKAPQFCYWNKPLTELWNKTLVVFGYGKIGQHVANTALALGMKVIAVPHKMPENKTAANGVTFMEFNEAVKLADFITLHCPLTNETEKLINKDSISKMKDGVCIINAARGGLINEKDMREALESGKVASFAADVVSVEPMLPDNPLLGAPNCILTPHIAWAPKETRERLIEAAAENLKAFLSGNPINKVN